MAAFGKIGRDGFGNIERCILVKRYCYLGTFLMVNHPVPCSHDIKD